MPAILLALQAEMTVQRHEIAIHLAPQVLLAVLLGERHRVASGEATGMRMGAIVAAEQGISQSYATRLVRLASLAPDIVEGILGRCQPANLTASRLIQDTRISTDWQDQRRTLGFV